MKRSASSSRGAVLVSSLFALVLIFVFLSSLMSLNALTAARERHAAAVTESYYAARAGMEAAIHFLEKAAPGTAPPAMKDFPEPGRRADEEIFYVHFHERGDGSLRGTLFDRGECEVSWVTDGAGAYIIQSTGRITGRARERVSRTVYARVEEHEGRLYITGWFE